MYTTKPLSTLRSRPEETFRPTPEGRNTGYLVVQDGEIDEESACCWGLGNDTRVSDLPFPQNRVLSAWYNHGKTSYLESVFFVPVLDRPLSSNIYHVVIAKGKNKGLVSTCSKEEDMTTCCFRPYAKDVTPQEFDPNDIYQQMEIIPHNGGFTAKAVAADGIPPFLFRSKYWRVHESKPKNYNLSEALGINNTLRSCLPEAELLATASTATSLTVGKWYSPFFFIKEEGTPLKEKMERAMFYEIDLVQHWEVIYEHDNLLHQEGNVVKVKTRVHSQKILLGGNLEAVQEGATRNGDAYTWFRGVGRNGERVGVSLALWERMKREQHRGGWVGDDEEVERVEEFGGLSLTGGGGWQKFACLVLVERFLVKRINGSLVVAFDFRHTNKITAKWE